MSTFTLTVEQLESIATLHHATVQGKAERAKDAQVLSHIKLTLTPTHYTAIATDRYIVAELSAPLDEGHAHSLSDKYTETQPLTLLINSEDLVDLAKRTRQARHRYLTLTVNDDDESTAPASVSVNAPDGMPYGGLPLSHLNLPNVERLFPRDNGDDCAPVSVGINPARLARLAKVMTPLLMASSVRERKDVVLDMRFTSGTQVNRDGSQRPGPVVITHQGVTLGGETFRALMQPMAQTVK